MADANKYTGYSRRHRGMARLSSSEMSSDALQKRFDNARFTFYDVSKGACGTTNVASDFVVALNSDQYGDGYPGPHCGETITITANGKTTTAVIEDECPGCPYAGLDLSRGLFDFFADESAGVIYGSWDFTNGN
ncbi:uncharacterized protein STEHIDRAFT_126526 [Stereum hirsutum FP-91666 SS1]|uniref:Plant expansin n=1 Tax=Stereum hirsutum (strain FP-91666) TaxID=721885 RepID=R7RY46_STEHR|nr:uncharacterized protein STEHIDRAFT_126526 [Stereum hirsutum FP-91666 SS1]EIM79277.1 hypothetical protein STEHIDRAFT_126526 [Stereum hirsutum FP-91666 SS1]